MNETEFRNKEINLENCNRKIGHVKDKLYAQSVVSTEDKDILSKNFMTANVGPRLRNSRRVFALSFPPLNAIMVSP